MHAGCNKESQEEDDFCNICWVEALSCSPCIKLDCGHVFHYSCIRKKLSERWPSRTCITTLYTYIAGARITFGFSDCPLCKQPIAHTSLQDLLGPIILLKKEVESKATQRLEYEGLSKSDDITDPKGRFYKKPTEYAMDKFSYFMCFKCKVLRWLISTEV